MHAALDTGIWTFVDPLGDASVTLTGTQAEIFVPGTLHDVWVGTNSVSRIRQAISDGDFEVEVRLDTPDLGISRSQGILIEQDDVNLIRFEFHDLGSGPRRRAHEIIGKSSCVLDNVR